MEICVHENGYICSIEYSQLHFVLKSYEFCIIVQLLEAGQYIRGLERGFGAQPGRAHDLQRGRPKGTQGPEEGKRRPWLLLSPSIIGRQTGRDPVPTRPATLNATKSGQP